MAGKMASGFSFEPIFARAPKNFFQKVLDKLIQLCYNVDTERKGEQKNGKQEVRFHHAQGVPHGF